jgi:hypothetical protein
VSKENYSLKTICHFYHMRHYSLYHTGRHYKRGLLPIERGGDMLSNSERDLIIEIKQRDPGFDCREWRKQAPVFATRMQTMVVTVTAAFRRWSSRQRRNRSMPELM